MLEVVVTGEELKIEVFTDGSFQILTSAPYLGESAEKKGRHPTAIPYTLSLVPIWNEWDENLNQISLEEGWGRISLLFDRETERRRPTWEPVLQKANAELPSLREEALRQFAP